VRFGSYGEPTLLPISLVSQIANAARGWTGYTHQWKRFGYDAYKRYFMASCTPADYEMAQSWGWRTFTVSRMPLAKQMSCPASEEFTAKRGFKLTCAACGLCNGTSAARGARSVVIKPHGAYANKVL
jgi:hypothetical protein